MYSIKNLLVSALHIFIASLLLFSVQSCAGFSEIEDPISRSSTDDFAAFRYEKLKILNGYLGKSKQDVLNVFGDPGSKINFDSKDIPYDEMWHYKYSKNILFLYYNEYGIVFYFVDDKVVKVNVL